VEGLLWRDFGASRRIRAAERSELAIYQGTTPLPGTAAWEALPDDEQKRIYADYGALNQAPGVAPGPPLGLPENATTVRGEVLVTMSRPSPPPARRAVP